MGTLLALNRHLKFNFTLLVIKSHVKKLRLAQVWLKSKFGSTCLKRGQVDFAKLSVLIYFIHQSFRQSFAEVFVIKLKRK